MLVVTNASRSESTLRKKSNAICYHALWEVAMGKVLIACIQTKKNLADLVIKILHGSQWQILVYRMLQDVYPMVERVWEGCGPVWSHAPK